MREPRQISILCTVASRMLTAAGWTVEYLDHGMTMRHGRLVRTLPYDDSLVSLVNKPDVELLVLLGKRRMHR